MGCILATMGAPCDCGECPIHLCFPWAPHAPANDACRVCGGSCKGTCHQCLPHNDVTFVLRNGRTTSSWLLCVYCSWSLLIDGVIGHALAIVVKCGFAALLTILQCLLAVSHPNISFPCSTVSKLYLGSGSPLPRESYNASQASLASRKPMPRTMRSALMRAILL